MGSYCWFIMKADHKVSQSPQHVLARKVTRVDLMMYLVYGPQFPQVRDCIIIRGELSMFFVKGLLSTHVRAYIAIRGML